MAAQAIGEATPQQHREEIARGIAGLDGLAGEILQAHRLDAGADGTSPHQRIDLIGLLAGECAPFDADLAGQSVFAAQAACRLAVSKRTWLPLTAAFAVFR